MTDTATDTGADDIIAIEGHMAQIGDYQEMIKDRFADMKSRGHDVKAVRKVIARRKRDRDEVADEDAMIEMIEAALEGK